MHLLLECGVHLLCDCFNILEKSVPELPEAPDVSSTLTRANAMQLEMGDRDTELTDALQANCRVLDSHSECLIQHRELATRHRDCRERLVIVQVAVQRTYCTTKLERLATHDGARALAMCESLRTHTVAFIERHSHNWATPHRNLAP